MLIYIVLLLIIILFSFLELYDIKINIRGICIEGRFIGFWVITVALFIVGTFRYKYVGPDARNYELYYFVPSQSISINMMKHISLSDPGYYLWNILVNHFTHDFQKFISVTFIVTFLPIAICIYKESTNYAFAYFIFYTSNIFMSELVHLRFQIALSICVIAYYFVRKSKWIWVALFIVFASSFHKTALILLIFIPVIMNRRRDIKKLFIIFYFIVAALFMRLLIPIFVSNYSKWDYSNAIVSGSGWKLLIVYIVIFGVTFYCEQKYINEDYPQEMVNLKILSTTTLFAQVLAIGFDIFSRIAYYGFGYFMIYSANILEQLPTKVRKSYWFVTIIIMSIIYLYQLNFSGVIPYEFIR